MARNSGRHENHHGFTLLVAGALIAISGRLAPCQICQAGPSTGAPIMVAPSEQMPAYEVASIRPWDGKGFGMPLRLYIQDAFGLPANSTGWVIGPDWINDTRYVIEAKPPDSTREAMQTMTNAERSRENALMQQSLLADRFRLKAHFETRERPVYELVLAKGGSKLKEEPDPNKHGFGFKPSALRGNGTIHDLITILGCTAEIGGERIIIDKTGLTGQYDFSLKWAPLQTATAAAGGNGTAPPPDVEGASLFTAIEEQLGLKLVPAKGPGQVLVIDHIERPSEN